MRIADGSSSRVAGTGSVALNKDLTLKHVLFVLSLSCNLISISQLTSDLNCVTKFNANTCVFQDLGSGKTIGNVITLE
ncbi:hypothetical protein, partial [Proteus mirabilis]|uniref:hypothetical protein n=1 Tax=Proteus mirabilis TaxID=584 RepID=UPI003F812D28